MNVSVNRVLLLGNLTRDPEVRYMPSGMANATLRLATTRRFKTQQGEDKEETCFVDVVVWGKQAETCGQYLSKGSPLFVEGRLQYDEWEKDGQKRNCVRVVAERTQFVGPPPRRTADGEAPHGASANTAARSGTAQASTPDRASPSVAAPTPAVAAAASTSGSAVNSGAGPGLPDEDNLPF